MQWRPGDFIISDNLALAHEASPETQLPSEVVGLRVMHRTTVQGQHVPRKRQQQQQRQEQRQDASGTGQ